MQLSRTWLALAVVGGLAACGDTVGEQAIIGSAVGAGTAVLLDGNLAAGAAVGAAGNILACELDVADC